MVAQTCKQIDNIMKIGPESPRGGSPLDQRPYNCMTPTNWNFYTGTCLDSLGISPYGFPLGHLNSNELLCHVTSVTLLPVLLSIVALISAVTILGRVVAII